MDVNASQFNIAYKFDPQVHIRIARGFSLPRYVWGQLLLLMLFHFFFVYNYKESHQRRFKPI